MTNANECTCPSGDGSLRHPCPAHPAVEQAGGDERAAFRPAQVISYRPGVGEVTIYVAGRVPGYMNIGDTVYVSDRAPVEHARAALAQPSPCKSQVAEALRVADWSNTCIGNKALILAAIEQLEAQPSPAQAEAEAERPEEFSFEYRHPNGECHTVTVSREQVINEMPDFLFEALCSKFCNCEPVGETNVVECCCDEYAEEFKLIAAAPGTEVPQAWLDVQAERRRQITAEGWTPDHDDLYCAAELPRAAAAYILSGANDEAPAIWPFVAKWWKPRDARANYVRAGALILAEIERLDRAAAPGKEGV
ncbi:hypothetical protein ACRCPD_24775 [Pseudomonas aeruginosa]